MSRRTVGWKRGVCISLASAAVAVALVEGAARLYLRLRGERILTIPREHYWENRARMKKLERGILYETNSRGFRGPEFDFRKPPGTTRIVCLGDSSTFGFLNREEESYPRLLENCLKQRDPGRHYEVINAGVSGYTTLQEAIALTLRVLPLDPDIVVIQCGHNNRNKNIDTGRSFLKARSGPLSRALGRSRFLYLARRLFRRFSSGGRRRFVPEESLANVHGDLALMIDRCREKGVEAIVLTWGQHPGIREHTRRGIDLYERGRYKEAIAELERAATVEYNWDWRPVHYLKLCYEKIGETREARRAAERERELTREHPWVIDEEPYLDAFASVARQRGARLLEYRGEKLTPDLFLDICHPSPKFTRRMAESLCEMIAGGGKEDRRMPIASTSGGSP